MQLHRLNNNNNKKRVPFAAALDTVTHTNESGAQFKSERGHSTGRSGERGRGRSNLYQTLQPYQQEGKGSRVNKGTVLMAPIVADMTKVTQEVQATARYFSVTDLANCSLLFLYTKNHKIGLLLRRGAAIYFLPSASAFTVPQP